MDESLLSQHGDIYKALGDREPSTLLEAKAVIENIRAEKGYLDPETQRDLNSMRARGRENILRIIELKKETEAAYTKSISEQLYSSKYRFLYELIQNADDSSYKDAKKNNMIPFLRFTVSPSAFIVESNEDGFTRANVEAICATGKSSKKASPQDNHIGEKGFGFKSVFAVAERVCIQSGLWSFRFEHREGDDGLGMVTPLDIEPVLLPDYITTRMTLTLREGADHDYQKLLEAIEDLPDTAVFFLQRLKKIVISTSLGNLDRTTRRITRSGLPSSGRVTITRQIQKQPLSGSVVDETEKNVYHVFSYVLSRMPSDTRRQGRSSAEVVLAFPVSSDNDQPKLSSLGQHIFAYLPLQRMSQFQFLVQSDFITSASRETVVDCLWNDAIRNGVVTTFSKAISNFATPEHPLLHSWLDYLPRTPVEGLWKPLYQEIKRRLREMPILQTWESRAFKCPPSIRRVPPSAQHEGEPILRDLRPEIYLSPEYSERHHGALEELGVTNCTFSDMVDRLQADVTTLFSTLKSHPSNHKWHESFAGIFLPLLQSNIAAVTKNRLKRLAIIPLSGGTKWTGAPGFSAGSLPNVYFPTIDGIDIPEDISLHLLEKVAASNPTRKVFYQQLGVKECSKETVLSQIENTHRHAKSFNCLPHFKFLFHFHPSPEIVKTWVFVPATSGKSNSTKKPLYFQSNHQYHTQRLLPTSYQTTDNNVALFIQDTVVDLEPSHIRPQGMSYDTWLRRATGARHYPSLTNGDSLSRFSHPGDSPLSDVFRVVLEHNPEKFVGALKEHWDDYQSSLAQVQSTLERCEVPCQSGEKVQFQSTYLPTEEIQAQLQKIGVEDGFPLLKLPVILDSTNHRQWLFLEEIGVRSKPDLEFYKIALGKLCSTTVESKDNITELYRCMARHATIEEQNEIGEFFEDHAAICCEDPEGGFEWKTSTECLWDGPDFIQIKAILSPMYGSDQLLTPFFRTFVEIEDCTVEDVLDDLSRKASSFFTNANDVSPARQVYQYLDASVQAGEDWDKVRKTFQNKALIYCGGQPGWRSLRSCLWSTPFALSEYVDVSTIYPELEHFFVQNLRIAKASTSMLIKELIRMSKVQRPRIDEIRQRLFEVGMLIAKSPVDDAVKTALQGLKDVKFLPKKDSNGTAILVGVTDDFAIPDHARYLEAFSEHNIMLDIPMHQAQAMDTIFRYLGIQHRYISTLVKEESSIDGEAIMDEALSEDLRAKAYALYCCAAKFKSIKALRDDLGLFVELSNLQIFPTDEIKTELVIDTSSSSFRVQSQRKSLHHDTSDGQLKIYVPKSSQEQRVCYRSQLPRLFAQILDIDRSNADHAVALILGNPLADIEDIQAELDIPCVDWIEKPALQISTPRHRDSIVFAPPRFDFGRQDRQSSTQSVAQDENDDVFQTPVPVRAPQDYERLVEQVVRSAHRVRDATTANQSRIRDPSPEIPLIVGTFDRVATFGDRNRDEIGHDRRIGAAGEAYVFEIISGLDLPGFSAANWQSTIRGELRDHPRYSDMGDWTGRERADIMYKDSTGALTTYLREKCMGGFPEGVDEYLLEDAGNGSNIIPIEYWLEVKTTTGRCGTRFFMSNNQVQKMQELTANNLRQKRQLYVILRVYDLGGNVGMRIYVDPWRLRGRDIEFEANGWTGKTI